MQVLSTVHQLLLALAKPGLPSETILYAHKGLGQMMVRACPPPNWCGHGPGMGILSRVLHVRGM